LPHSHAQQPLAPRTNLRLKVHFVQAAPGAFKPGQGAVPLRRQAPSDAARVGAGWVADPSWGCVGVAVGLPTPGLRAKDHGREEPLKLHAKGWGAGGGVWGMRGRAVMSCTVIRMDRSHGLLCWADVVGSPPRLREAACRGHEAGWSKPPY